MRQLRIRNWERFQHYKDRNPPWIKLATDTFQNYEFACLQDASKLLAICIWTLAARSKDGSVAADLQWIKNQCSLGDSVTSENINELINKGFLSADSDVLADCKQNACLETETETETEKTKSVEARTSRAQPTRGARLPVEWTLPADWKAWAKSERPGINLELEADKFRDYWTAKTGQAATKADWQATWRNWVRNAQPNTAPLRRFEPGGQVGYASEEVY